MVAYSYKQHLSEIEMLFILINNAHECMWLFLQTTILALMLFVAFTDILVVFSAGISYKARCKICHLKRQP